VQFMEYVDTFEYLSCEAALAEWEINNEPNGHENDAVDDRSTNSDQDGNDDEPDDELGRLAKINANLNAKNLSETAAQSKGKRITCVLLASAYKSYLLFSRFIAYVSSKLS
jgi:hypothetical protein